MALLRSICGPKLVGKGVVSVAFLRVLGDPSLERRVILGISANDVWPLVNKWERALRSIAAIFKWLP